MPLFVDITCGDYVQGSTHGKVNYAGYPSGDVLYNFSFPAGQDTFTIGTCNGDTNFDTALKLYDAFGASVTSSLVRVFSII